MNMKKALLLLALFFLSLPTFAQVVSGTGPATVNNRGIAKIGERAEYTVAELASTMACNAARNRITVNVSDGNKGSRTCRNTTGSSYAWVNDDPRYNIVNFGAGNGLSTDAIQAAADAAAAESGTVYVPPGEFEIDDEIILPAGVSLQGDGAASKIRQTVAVKNIIEAGDGCVIENLYLEGSGLSNNASLVHGNGILAIGRKRVQIKGNYITGIKDGCGIQIRDSFDTQIVGNVIWGNTWDTEAIGAASSSTDIVMYSGTASGRTLIQGNYALSNNSQGISCNALGYDTDLIVTDNFCVPIDPNTYTPISGASLVRRHGILVSYSTTNSGSKVTVANNFISGATWTGIYVNADTYGDQPLYRIIQGNLIADVGHPDNLGATQGGGIFVSGIAEDTVVNNTIVNQKCTNASTGGITVSTSGGHPLLKGNRIIGSQSSGIVLVNSTNFASVKDNEIIGSALSDIALAPSTVNPDTQNFTIKDNRFYRTNQTSPSIDNSRGSLPTGTVEITGNDFYGAGVSGTTTHANSAVKWNYTAGIIFKDNKIFNYAWGLAFSAYFSGARHLDGVRISRNEFSTVTNAYGIVSGGNAAVVLLEDDRYVGVTNIVGANIGGNTAGWVGRRGGSGTVEVFGTAAPSVGTWAVGDRVWNTSPTATGAAGWICTTAGSPGTWDIIQTFDALNTFNAQLNLNAVGGQLRLRADGTASLDGAVLTNALGNIWLSNWNLTRGIKINANGTIETLGTGLPFTMKSTLALTNAAVTATSGGTTTLDLSIGNVRTVTMPAGNTTLALSNVPVGVVDIAIVQDSGGGRTITFPSTMKNGTSTLDLQPSPGANERTQYRFQCDGTNCILTSYQPDGFGATGTATATAGAATLNTQRGTITTEALTTASGSTYALTLTNSKVTTSSIVTASVQNGTNSVDNYYVQRVTPGSGSVVITVYNNSGSALNGTIKISFIVM